MLIIGERINTSRKINKELVIENAVRNRDADYVVKLASDQVDAGAHYVDLNCGTLHEGEAHSLQWLTETIQARVPGALCFDSPSAEALAMALEVYDTGRGQPMINSITAETERFDQILPLALKHKAKVIALAMDEAGIQPDGQKRYEVALALIRRLTDAGVPIDDIYVDPLTFPIGTGSDFGVVMLDVVRRIKDSFPDVHVTAGVSNVSHGMPARKILNEAMLVLAMGAGMDSAIIDPMDRHLMALIAASESILGLDEFSMNYIALARAGKFEGL
ncbi:MAG: dihydropteroate synthase [Armatimonadetes bacterium]|nr:dihydropteroate synthase [Armatimonadota bacterium]